MLITKLMVCLMIAYVTDLLRLTLRTCLRQPNTSRSRWGGLAGLGARFEARSAAYQLIATSQNIIRGTRDLFSRYLLGLVLVAAYDALLIDDEPL